MYDIKLNDSHDIDISTLDMQVVDGIERVKQQILIRLRTFAGEWFLDTRKGIPWTESVLVKRPNLNYVRSLLYDEIATVEGVKSVDSLNMQVDTKERKMTVNYVATTIYGEVKEVAPID
ncbi:hypothetical protein [Anaerosolibacter sp.]|uniref:hypothetical protein n=1 Tax=Anaerosolibacter sp. TaxID=1872527 RepID=UPI0039F10F61